MSKIPVCPECDSHRIHSRSSMRETTDGRTWRCRACQSTFDDAVRRAKRSNGGMSAEAVLSQFGGAADD